MRDHLWIWIPLLGLCCATAPAAVSDSQDVRPVIGQPQGLAPTTPGMQRPDPGMTTPLLPGTHRAQVQGCLASPGAPPAPPARAAAAPTDPGIELRTTPAGMRVEHRLRHACCLGAEVQVRIAAEQVEIDEVLSGSPCRCMCDSNLLTDVGLAPGSYVVVVREGHKEELREVLRQSIQVPRPGLKTIRPPTGVLDQPTTTTGGQTP